MSRQIIRQPNKLFAEYSTFTDTMVFWDATAEEIIDHREERAAKEARQHTEDTLKAIARGEDLYHGCGVTWKDAVRNHNRNMPGNEITIKETCAENDIMRRLRAARTTGVDMGSVLQGSDMISAVWRLCTVGRVEVRDGRLFLAHGPRQKRRQQS